MSIVKQNNFLVFLFLAAIAVILSISGCKEGTEKSPVSSLLTDMDSSNYLIDVSESEDATHIITGLVSSQNTSENLGNIDAKLLLNKQLVATTKTTSDGRFYFSKLPPGLYEIVLTSSDDSYNKTTYIVRILDDGTTQPEAPVVNLELTNPGTAPINAKIEGEIIDSSSGTKLSNINIELVKSDGTLHSTALTNANGYFYFDNLTSAEVYTIKAGKASNFTEEQQNVTIRNDNVVSPRYLIMRLSTKPIEKFSISGTVKTPENQAIINAEVKIFDDIDLTISSAQATRTTGDGTFIFDELSEPKIYYLKVIETSSTEASQVYPIRVLANGETSPELAAISVSAKDNIVTYDISGMIYDVFTGGPLEYVSIKFDNESSFLTDKNGLFLAKNVLPGNYSLSINKYGYETTKATFSIENDGTTRPNKLSFPLTHTLKSGYGSIAGRFINIDNGEGVANLFVRLYKWKLYSQEKYVTIFNNGNPTDVLVTATGYGYDDALVLTTKTSNPNNTELSNELAGSFKLTHLEPGKYLVYITSSSSEPAPTTYSTLKSSATFNWPIPNTLTDAGFKAEIRSLEVLARQTTYWTNYEQEYK
jgi:hypothetical protein